MSLKDNRHRTVPRYYKTMYRDGFTPDEIWFAAKRDLMERLSQPQQEEDYSVLINPKVEVKK